MLEFKESFKFEVFPIHLNRWSINSLNDCGVSVSTPNSGFEIKTFETTALVGSGGGSSTVGRISDF